MVAAAGAGAIDALEGNTPAAVAALAGAVAAAAEGAGAPFLAPFTVPFAVAAPLEGKGLAAGAEPDVPVAVPPAPVPADELATCWAAAAPAWPAMMAFAEAPDFHADFMDCPVHRLN
jgi:hypothetical protein